MALSLWTDFGSPYELGRITTGQGWTLKFGGSVSAREIEEHELSINNRVLRVSRSGVDFKAVTWDAFDSEEDLDDVEIIVRMWSDYATSTSAVRSGVCARAVSGETCYAAIIQGDARDELAIIRYINESDTVIDVAELPSGLGQNSPFYLAFRCRTDGNGDVELSARVWTGTVGDDPGTPQAFGVDDGEAKLTNLGSVGVFNVRDPSYTDWIGVATGGDPAPTGPEAGEGPTLSNGTANDIGTDTVTLGATTDTGEGDAWYVIVARDATAPSEAQIKAGNDASDSPAIASDSREINATGAFQFDSSTGLSDDTEYDAYIYQEDDEENGSNILKVQFSTLSESATYSWETDILHNGAASPLESHTFDHVIQFEGSVSDLMTALKGAEIEGLSVLDSVQADGSGRLSGAASGAGNVIVIPITLPAGEDPLGVNFVETTATEDD